jgi:shikimate kinase
MVMHMNTQKNKTIVLVGMMGAGKTHIGKALAAELNLQCIDSDRVIEDKAGMTIPEIFESYGETKFRDSEHRTIIETLDAPPCVLSTGGGALMDARTLAVLKDRAIMVWIDAPIDIIWNRVKDSDRPLLQKPDARTVLENLIEQRTPLYAQAHIRAYNDSDNARRAVQHIIDALEALPACPET